MSGIMDVDLLASGQPEDAKLYTMEQWDALFPPIARRQPKEKAVFGRADPDLISLPVEQTNGQSVASFNNLCQQHGIAPNFTIDEVAKGCFSVKVEFGDQTCEDPGPYPSKKQAKEDICRRALGLLEAIPKPAKQKRKSSDVASLDEESWKAILNEHAQKSNHRPPYYQDHEIDLRDQQVAGNTTRPRDFACTLMIEAAPGQMFGDRTSLYSTKVEARRLAAKEAVVWLRAMGLLSESSKQRKLADEGGQFGLTQGIARLKTDQSVPQLVSERSIQLGLSPPSYHTMPAAPPAGASGPSFYTAYANYLPQDAQNDARLQGRLFETGPVFGQKKAKQMCAQGLLVLLDTIADERRRT